MSPKDERLLRLVEENTKLKHTVDALQANFIKAEARLTEVVAALEQAKDTLIWASGAFDTQDRSAAWLAHGRPTMEQIDEAQARARA